MHKQQMATLIMSLVLEGVKTLRWTYKVFIFCFKEHCHSFPLSSIGSGFYEHGRKSVTVKGKLHSHLDLLNKLYQSSAIVSNLFQ